MHSGSFGEKIVTVESNKEKHGQRAQNLPLLLVCESKTKQSNFNYIKIQSKGEIVINTGMQVVRNINKKFSCESTYREICVYL